VSRLLKRLFAGTALAFAFISHALAQDSPKVVDIPTRPGVTQRMLVLSPPDPKATVILMAGGNGGLNLQPSGYIASLGENFLVRTRQLFAAQGLMVLVLDAPSDRSSAPYLNNFRQTPSHAADLKAVIAWAREQVKVPVWLVGTSRGTQSVGYAATELQGADGPDGIVLTSTILTDEKGRPVPAMPLDRIRIPVLVVHHEQDGCALCAYSEVAPMMDKLANAPKKQLLSFKGGESKGDPCAARAFHGFNGLDTNVVSQIAAWITAR
jgi:pimeloyl-ACP methyl ester carboxylesterase